jgi:methylisocitrate lyase
MSAAATRVYGELRRQGTQQGLLDAMQTRAGLYEVLGYEAYERRLDELFATTERPVETGPT